MPDLDRIHHVALTEGEISTILYYLDQVAEDIGDAYIPSPEVQSIYSKLEGSVDAFYDKLEKARQESKGQQAFEEYLEQRNGMQPFIPNFHD
tara:strand:+ start:147 stop:422 length:276 start_codon:yes stop_codon:yes gene_type:complete